MEIRALKASEIDVRVQSFYEDKMGAVVLLYKDARVDMRILDETFGMFGWQRRHDVVNGNLFCTLSIWDETKQQWVDKQDVGVESNTEKEKGEASDSFKRAGVNVGIGRELYTSPFIWVNINEEEIIRAQGKTPKISPKLKFRVSAIGYNDAREINRLVIVDNNGKERYVMGKKVEAPAEIDRGEQRQGFYEYPDGVPNPPEAPEDGHTNDRFLSCSICGKEITSEKSKTYYANHPAVQVKCYTCSQNK